MGGCCGFQCGGSGAVVEGTGADAGGCHSGSHAAGQASGTSAAVENKGFHVNFALI